MILYLERIDQAFVNDESLRCCLDEGCFEWYDRKLITHHSKLVGLTKKILFGLHHFVLVILSLKNLSDEA